MNQDNAKGRYISNNEEFYAIYHVGDWTFKVNQAGLITHIVVSIPSGGRDGDLAVLPIRPAEDQHASWGWNGSLEAPTLTPSILHYAGDGWHGWMRNGELISV